MIPPRPGRPLLPDPVCIHCGLPVKGRKWRTPYWVHDATLLEGIQAALRTDAALGHAASPGRQVWEASWSPAELEAR